MRAEESAEVNRVNLVRFDEVLIRFSEQSEILRSKLDPDYKRAIRENALEQFQSTYRRLCTTAAAMKRLIKEIEND